MLTALPMMFSVGDLELDLRLTSWCRFIYQRSGARRGPPREQCHTLADLECLVRGP